MNSEQFKEAQELVQAGFFDLEVGTPQKTWHIGLETKLIDTLIQRAAKVKAVVAQANFIIGEELATAQKELTYKNGGFVKWLEEEVGIDNERAYEFIRIWENYKMFALSANISSLGKKVLLAGAQKDVPESARQEIVARHEAGEKITQTTADEIVERHKAEIKELEEAKQKLQREFNLFKEDREKEKKKLNDKIQGMEQEKAAKQERLRKEAEQKLNEDLEKQRQEQEVKLKKMEKELKDSYSRKEQEYQLKAENTIRGLLSHGVKSMGGTQQTLEHTVSDGMLQAVQQLAGTQLGSFLAQAKSLRETLDRVEAKLTQGNYTQEDYIALPERIIVNG